MFVIVSHFDSDKNKQIKRLHFFTEIIQELHHKKIHKCVHVIFPFLSLFIFNATYLE